MSSFKGIIRVIGDTIIEHSPLILTICGCAGVVSTAILASRATVVVSNDIRDREEKEGIILSKKEIVKEYWKDYIPTFIIGGASIACIIGSNSINNKRQLALASAYKLAETSLIDYKEEVKEIIGEKKERAIQDKISKKKVEENPPKEGEIIVSGYGNTLFYDSYTGRYFESDIEKVRRIENELNKRLLSEMFISLNELYYEIGLPSVPAGNEMGWNIDEEGLIEIRYSAQIVTYKEKEVPCIAISYIVGPRFNIYGDR